MVESIILFDNYHLINFINLPVVKRAHLQTDEVAILLGGVNRCIA